MDPIVMILIAAFLGIGALVVGIGTLVQGQTTSKAESRLAAFTGGDTGGVRIVDELMQRIPRARRVDIPGAGHMLPLEVPAQLSRELRQFADDL